MLSLDLPNVRDEYVRENFRQIKEEATNQVFFNKNFQFREVIFTQAETNFKYAHNLAFTPKDVILLSKTGSATVTFNYDSFDATNLDITVSGATTLRFFVGRYE